MPISLLELLIIDAIGPFFRGYKDDPINWSKIPFQHLEQNGRVDRDLFRKIRKYFAKFLDRAAEMGYNAISLDDLAHLVNFDCYPTELQTKLQEYQTEYQALFTAAHDRNMRIFINTDLMFFNAALDAWTQRRDERILVMLREALEQVFKAFPVDGVITRIGESDGVDVHGDFHSRLLLKTPRQANRYLRELLPTFEQWNKLLIFRTWTIGAYKIGDLIWNEQTYDQVFEGLDSPHLIVSMKYGDTDFFDHLPLNPLFFRGPCRKILELQTRREREGFGVLPYHRVLEDILYIDGFADQPLYFMRVRIPPLLWVCWDQVTLNPLMMALHNYAGQRRFEIPKKQLKQIRKLGRELHLPDIQFLYETLKILAACRKVMWKQRGAKKLQKKLKKYRKKYPDSFDFSANLSRYTPRVMPMAFKILLRKQARYRWLDKLLMQPFMLRLLYLFFRFFSTRSRNLPKFVDKQAMPIEVFFKS